MTIQEAIKSGLPFKLPDWTIYLRADMTFDQFIYNVSELRYDHRIERPFCLLPREILSEDWQIESKENA